jgi:GATA-binding protein
MTGPAAVAANAAATLSYEHTQDSLVDAFGTTHSELVGAFGQDQTLLFQNTFQFQYPGSYHPDFFAECRALLQAAGML